MACNATPEIHPGLPLKRPEKYRKVKIRFDFRASFAAHHRSVIVTVVLSILYLCASGQCAKAYAIDVYHFLVEFKNGRVVERIFSESPESYEGLFKEYVIKTKLIEKRHYSVDGFILTFGKDAYEDLMAGYFGVGLEEEIIFDRQTQGLEFDAGALPPPDETSAKLLEVWRNMDFENVVAGSEKITLEPPDDVPSKTQSKALIKATPSQPDLPKKSEKDGDRTGQPSFKGAANMPLQAEEKHEKEPTSPHPSPSPEGERIDVYRFLVQYINGKTVEKTTTITPKQYEKRYPGYVTKTALVQKKSYSKDRFKDVFGEKAHSLLLQGNFGVGDMEMIMQSRTERGMPPRKNVLPPPGPESEKLSKKMEHLLRNRNFTLQGPNTPGHP